MPLARLDDLAMRLSKQVVTESERLVERTRHAEHARIGGDPDNGAQHRGREAEASVARYDIDQPGAADRVLWRVLAKGIDEDVDVRQDHLFRPVRGAYAWSSISCRPDRSFRSIPGIRPPRALLTRGMPRSGRCFAGPATTRRKPSSMSEVSV